MSGLVFFRHLNRFVENWSVKIRARSITLESLIDVGQGISVGPGKFAKNNKRRALNKKCQFLLIFSTKNTHT